MRIGPRTSADASAPMSIAICWYFGVEPTRKPVFKSCEVVPPFDAAMQTIAPMERAGTSNCGAVQPMTKNTRLVKSSVATVIPEKGLDDEPSSSVKREETVRNRER